MQQMRLNERFDRWDEDLSVDMENRLVLNVALAGQMSRNGYRYTEDALSTATALYEGKPVFLDHASNRLRPHDRSTRDLVGSITNPRFVAGRIRGDIRVLETDSGETFLKLVNSQTPGVGMSHVVLAERTADGKEVGHISDVISVDVVVNPATTTTFRESHLPKDESSDSEAPSKTEHQEAEQRSEELVQAQQECERLRNEVERLRNKLSESADRESVQQLLANSGLPSEAITECFHRQLLKTSSTALRQQLVQDRLALVSSNRQSVGRAGSHERISTSTSRRLIDDEFISVLRRR